MHTPVAIGAVGGSGTRMLAQLLREAGYFIGSDLNEANDCLWFTLLFKRREILVEPRRNFDRLIDLFFRRMQGTRPADDDTRRLIVSLARQVRPQHPPEWLARRAESFLNGDDAPTSGLWGWKCPNTHIVIEHMLEAEARLRYIHVRRNGLDMAYSANQNQLAFWGAIFLGRDISRNPRDSLAYWCAVDRRMTAIARRFPDRVLFVDFDRFCREPVPVIREILGFCGRTLGNAAIDAFAAGVRVPESAGRFRTAPPGDFDPADIDYVAGLGYPTV
jgi:hypothetical protein